MKLVVFIVAVIALAEANRINPRVFGPIKLPKVERKNTPSGRITGGDEVAANSIPYQVGLFIPTDDGTVFCGGSLISRTTVLTAAHCGELSNSIEVVLGAHRIRENEATQVRVTSRRVLVHPGWNSLLLQNDIALIILPEPVQLNDNINLISLPRRSDISNSYDGDLATASGWGKDADSSNSISDVLRAVKIPVGSNLICNLYYFGTIQGTHICASGDGGKSTCSGDSGGPLVSSSGDLIGITSFGIALGCEIGWPAVFTRVTQYLDWIEENSDVEIR